MTLTTILRKSAMLVALILAPLAVARAQAVTAPVVAPAPTYLLGSGLGFKPYQTSIKDGSSGFVEGAVQVSAPLGVYTFATVVMHPTYAELLVEPCKAALAAGRYTLFLCGGVGMGANSDNVGIAFDAGGKLAYEVSGKLLPEKTWLIVEMGVTKTTVPAPVSAAGVISPVQPAFRVGIFKTF